MLNSGHSGPDWDLRQDTRLNQICTNTSKACEAEDKGRKAGLG